jgi:hypothetical protein
MSGAIMGAIYGIVSLIITAVFLVLDFNGMSAITTSSNLTNMTGTATMVGMSPILVLVFSLFASGLLAFAGAMGSKVSGMKQAMGVIGGQIVLLVFIYMFPIIITFWNLLWTAAGATSQAFVGMIPMIVWILFIVGSAWWSVAKTGGVGAVRKYVARRRSRSAYRR